MQSIIVMSCSVCHKPGAMKDTCDHCWEQHRCHRFACIDCTTLGVNYGSVVVQFQCGQCEFVIFKYENGACTKPFRGYGSDYGNPDDYDKVYAKHAECTICKAFIAGKPVRR
jgi:hypothetical protein